MYNFTIFQPRLYLYDDRLVYKKRHILTHDEFSVSYNHISQVNLINFIYLYAHIEIATTGVRDFEIKWIRKPKAYQAKKIIDEKIHSVAISAQKKIDQDTTEVREFELSLSRLKELLTKGSISQREFNKKRKKLLKKYF